MFLIQPKLWGFCFPSGDQTPGSPVVTGAGQSEGQGMGNGRATAIAFAREGATVVLADRDEASARETAETIGERASVVEADVAVEDDCARIVATCLERHGRVDVLHHNVGTGTGDGWAENLDMEAWERIMRVNAGSGEGLVATRLLNPIK